MKDSKIIWYNFRTKAEEGLDTPPSDYRDYIPQDFITQNMYTNFQKMGYSPDEAARKTRKILTKLITKTEVEK